MSRSETSSSCPLSTTTDDSSQTTTTQDESTPLAVNIFNNNTSLRNLSSSPIIIRRLPVSVVNKIAAGEVIHRPVNAIKELLENSLDAGATNVQIIIEDGGLTSIQIIDNGHGISRYNHLLLCKRHSTSKLTTSNDLNKINTFGFRGEALASISAVSEVLVTTFNKAIDLTGWQASYKDGEVVEGSLKVKVMPSQGTRIFINKIFDGIPIRKQALKSPTEERKLIVNLVTRYAIHNCDKVTISLREALASNDLVCTVAPKNLKNCVGSFFGPEIERESSEFNLKNDSFKFDGHIMLSQIASNVRRFNFILFINNRLVECPELKKDVDALMTEFSNSKTSQVFVYISLKVNPADIDVNVHPAKTCVTLHFQSELIEFIVSSLKNRLNDDRYTHKTNINGHYSQPTLSEYTGSQLTRKRPFGSTPTLTDDTRLRLLAPNTFTPSPPKRPSNLVHNHHSDRKLTELYNRDSDPMVFSQSPINLTVINEDSPSYERENRDENDDNNDKNENNENNVIHVQDDDNPPAKKTKTRPRRDTKIPLKLRSVQNLRHEVGRNSDSTMTQFLRESIFVGSFSGAHALVQNSTKLYVLKLQNLLKELYYQLYLYDFGHFSAICVKVAKELPDLIESYFAELPSHLSKNLQYPTTVSVIEKLVAHSDMLEDYFSITINSSTIDTLPSLVPGEEPDSNYLGKFLVDLANLVNWDDEQECFETIGRAIANFYATPPIDLDKSTVQRHYNVVLERKLFPLMKQYLFVQKSTARNGNIYQISDTTELYKVFERC